MTKIKTTNTKNPPSLVRIAALLKKNEFRERYISSLLKRAREELSKDILQNFNAVQERVLEWIGESVKIFQASDRQGAENRNNSQIMVLIGPTGVGKTTVIAKLAGIFGIKNSWCDPLPVRIITTDTYRIGAVDQITKFGNIMNIPVSCANNNQELRKELELHREKTNLFLIDTIGQIPRDPAKIKEMLDACGPKAEVHLVLSASTKANDNEHILRCFEMFNYKAVLLTKFDETMYVGDVISTLAENGKKVSYITDGPNIPNSIRKANPVLFLNKLKGFTVDKEKMERFFSGMI